MDSPRHPEREARRKGKAAKRDRKTDSAITRARKRGDFVAIADWFANDAIVDEARDRHCRWIRLAASRYLKDRRRAEENGAPFWFSSEWANDACDFIEKLPHVEGKWETPEIVLHPAHVFFLVNLFGFRKLTGPILR